VHEDGNCNHVTLSLGSADKRQVAFMQSAHRRNQTETSVIRACSATSRARFRNGRTNIHACRDAASRVSACSASEDGGSLASTVDPEAQGASRNSTFSSLRVPRSKARFL